MRWANQNGVVKPINTASAQTITWTGGDLPPGTRGQGIVGHTISFNNTSGAGANDLSDVTRIRVKANGQLVRDITPTQECSWLERFSSSNFGPPLTTTGVTIWYNDPSFSDNAQADQVSQFPYSASPTIEIQTGNLTVTGTAIVTTIFSSEIATYYPVLLGQAMNIAASQPSAYFPFSEGGLVRGVMMPTLGIDRLRLQISGFDMYNGAGPGFGGVGAGANFRDPILETQLGEYFPTTYFTTPWYEIHGVAAQFGSSGVALVTTAQWAGVGNEFAYWALRPQA